MAIKTWVGVAGTGAIGACLLGFALLQRSAPSVGSDAPVGPVPITISAPPPLPVPAPPAVLPQVEEPSVAPPAIVEAPSVPGGAPSGKAGIWSVPAEFAPPE